MVQPIEMPRKWPKKTITLSLVVLMLAGIGGILHLIAFGAPSGDAELAQFTVPVGFAGDPVEQLVEEGFAKREWGMRIVFWKQGVAMEPGAYKLSRGVDAWELARAIAKGPYMKWVVIPEGLRKEEIADILASTLGWSDEVKQQWITVHTAREKDYTEGVYFPDTYLIPIDEAPEKVAERLRAKFNEVFAEPLKEARKQNIRWPTLVRIASIIEREAAGKDDMPLVAGILWNRLLKGQRLEVDATLQYIKGTPGNWWPEIAPEDKRSDSPYNTYRHKGVPPHPISNPGLSAINAVLYPQETACFYYLHDDSGVIHCAETYDEHQENIEQYLK